jgi:hypothetical protein
MTSSRALRAAFILCLGGLALYAWDRLPEGQPGQSFYRRLADRFFGDGSYGLVDRLYVCIRNDVKAAWDNPGDPSLDPDTREWIEVHRRRVEILTKLLGYTNYELHDKYRGAAFGIDVPRMPSDPALRARQLADYRDPSKISPDVANTERKNPCHSPGIFTQENKLTFSRWVPKTNQTDRR